MWTFRCRCGLAYSIAAALLTAFSSAVQAQEESNPQSAVAAPLAAESGPGASETEQVETQPSAAQSPTTRLETVTVTATKTGRDTFETPGHVSVLTHENIEQQQPQDVADLISDLPGIEIGGGPRRIRERPYIRGLGGTRVLLTVDGARLNFNNAHRGNLDFVDVESLDSLEVIRGPASALYGSSALGGAVHMRTRNPRDMLEVGRQVGARARFQFNSVNQEFSEHISLFGHVREKFDYLLRYTRRDAADIGTGDGDIDHSGYDTNDFFLKARYRLTDADIVGFNFQLFDDTSEYPFSPEATQPYESLAQDDDTERTLYSVNYQHDAPDSWLSHISLVGYLQQTEILEDERSLLRTPGSPGVDNSPARRRGCPPTFCPDVPGTPATLTSERVRDMIDFDTWGVELRGSTPFTWPFARHRVTYGFEFFRDESEVLKRSSEVVVNAETNMEMSRDSQDTTQFPDAHSNNYGFYIQDEIELFDRITLIPGLRYDLWELSARSTDMFVGSLTEDERTDDKLSPKVALVLKLTDNLRLTGDFSKGFRTPTFRELFIAGPHFPGAEFLANPDLQPEKSTSYQAGLQGRFSRAHFSAHYFYNDLDDFIDYGASPILTFDPIQRRLIFEGLRFQAQNIRKARIWGVETVAGVYPLDFLYLYGTYTYTKGTNSTNGEPLTDISPQRAKLAARYTDPLRQFWVEWAAHLINDQSRVPRGAPRTAGYALFDLRGSWQMTRGLRLALALENMADRAYRRHLSSLKGEGLNVALSLTYDW